MIKSSKLGACLLSVHGQFLAQFCTGAWSLFPPPTFKHSQRSTDSEFCSNEGKFLQRKGSTEKESSLAYR